MTVESLTPSPVICQNVWDYGTKSVRTLRMGLKSYNLVQTYLNTHIPIRRHAKRRNQSNAYHLRIQKKWLRRFGTKRVGDIDIDVVKSFRIKDLPVITVPRNSSHVYSKGADTK